MKLPTIIRSESMLISWHDKSVDQFCNFSLTAKRRNTTSCSFVSWRNWWIIKKAFSRLLFHVKTVLDSRSLCSNQQNNCVSRYIFLCSWHNVTTATEKCRVMTKCFHIMTPSTTEKRYAQIDEVALGQVWHSKIIYYIYTTQ